MSGLLALLDDVAAIARLAATQFDDIAAQAAKAGGKTAGVLIDDAAVTPKYVVGLPAARELPIVWQIARASFFNKLVILLPIAILLNTFAPWVLTYLLMLGGAYLCFEGAEKVWHWLRPGAHAKAKIDSSTPLDAVHLEKKRVAGAIKTDFILSAEIMTIALSQIEAENWVLEAVILTIVAIAVTIAVYGSVALIVKGDDFGLRLQESASRTLQAIGAFIVRAMPILLNTLMIVGTLAMLWVGGNIIVHGLHVLGFHPPQDIVYAAASNTAEALSVAKGFVKWLVTATLDGIFGLALGLLLMGPVGWILHKFDPTEDRH